MLVHRFLETGGLVGGDAKTDECAAEEAREKNKRWWGPEGKEKMVEEKDEMLM